MLTLGADGDAEIIGLAPQGENMAVGVFLPDFGAFDEQSSVAVSLGPQRVSERFGISPVNSVATATASFRAALSQDDDAHIAVVQLYDLTKAGVSAAASVDKNYGVIRYEFHGDPVMYFLAGSPDGTPLAAGTDTILDLKPYEHGARTVPRDTQERYLFELTTDGVPNAGTSADILMSVDYIDLTNRGLSLFGVGKPSTPLALALRLRYNAENCLEGFYGHRHVKSRE